MTKGKYRKRQLLKKNNTRIRLCVYKSNRNIYAQLIDDVKGETKCQMSTLSDKNRLSVESSKKIGLEIAKKALKENIKKVWFDRGRFIYHGRVKAVADGAREGGLEF